MREDQIQNAISFLRDAKVKSSPLTKQVAFLESKGLTADEIREAFDRVKGESGQTTITNISSDSGPSVPPRPENVVPYQEPGLSFRDILFGLVGTAGVGYSIYMGLKVSTLNSDIVEIKF